MKSKAPSKPKRGRPRKYKNEAERREAAAERQRAYRERQAARVPLTQEECNWIADQLEPLIEMYPFQTADQGRAIEMLRGKND